MLLAGKDDIWFNINTVKPYYYPGHITTVWHGEFTGTIYAIGDQAAWDYTHHVVTERKMRNINAITSVIADYVNDIAWVLPFYDKEKDFGGLFFIHKKDDIITSRVVWVNDNTPLQIISGCEVVTSQKPNKRAVTIRYLLNKGVSKEDILAMKFAITAFTRKATEIGSPYVTVLVTEPIFEAAYGNDN